MFKLKLWLQQKKRNARNKWYELMKPLANYLTERDNKKYQRIKNSITKDEAVAYLAKGIQRELIRFPKDSIYILICDWFNDDHLSGYYKIGCYNTQYLKKGRERIALNKFRWDIEMQELVIEKLRTVKGIKITEEIQNFRWEGIENYKKTYIVSIEK
ncbi:hypothetical protein [Halalkalibacter oceani]|uniref:hypothetical protein n=1 Tax=Halalkalibacter oceani TaxID=1653776 RepID=UPI00339B0E97